MATLTWNGSSGFNLADLDLSNLAYGIDYTQTSTRFTVEYNYSGSTRDEFRGYGLTYSRDGIPTGGVVTGYASYDYGRKIGSIEGTSIAVTSLVAAASTGSSSDDLKVFRSLLSGSDRITGGSYGDKLEGFGGNDMLYGRQGADRLYGGAGADAFTFKSVRDSTVDAGGRDTIQDFSAAQKDRVDLRSIDANTTVGGNQAFSFIGKNGFHNKAGELRYEKYGSGVLVSGDVNGDSSADFAIYMNGLSSLSKGYFIL
jgi:Ca2+-binding RTX toxin-like protein